MFIQVLKRILGYETELVMASRARGKTVIKPSTVVAILIAVLYLLSPLDLIPEEYVHPTFFGFIDDVLILLVAGAVTYTDIGGVFDGRGVQPTSVQRTERVSEKVEISVQDGPKTDTDNIRSADNGSGDNSSGSSDTGVASVPDTDADSDNPFDPEVDQLFKLFQQGGDGAGDEGESIDRDREDRGTRSEESEDGEDTDELGDKSIGERF